MALLLGVWSKEIKIVTGWGGSMT